MNSKGRNGRGSVKHPLRLKVAQQSQEIPKLEKEPKELKEKLKSLE